MSVINVFLQQKPCRRRLLRICAIFLPFDVCPNVKSNRSSTTTRELFDLNIFFIQLRHHSFGSTNYNEAINDCVLIDEALMTGGLHIRRKHFYFRQQHSFEIVSLLSLYKKTYKTENLFGNTIFLKVVESGNKTTGINTRISPEISMLRILFGRR